MSEFTFYNATSGQLTLTCDGTTYSYIGRATPQTIQQPFGVASGSFGEQSGYSTYKIDWDGDVIAIVPVPTAGSCTCVDQSKSGSTWTFVVENGNGTLDGNGFENQAYTTVYVFGAPPPYAVPGFLMYDVNGIPCGDLSRKPLTYKSIFTMAAGVLTTPAPGGTFGILGGLLDYRVQYDTLQGNQIVATYYMRRWTYNTSTGNVERREAPYQRINSSTNNGSTGTNNPVTAIYVDLAGLN